MRHQIITLFLAASATLAAAASAKNDTVAVIEHPKAVTVTTTTNGTTILTVKGKEGNDNYTYSYQTGGNNADSLDIDFVEPTIEDFSLPFMRKKEPAQQKNRYRSFEYTWFNNVYLGIPDATHCGVIRNGFEVGVLSIFRLNQRLWRHGPSLSVGFGMGYQRLRAPKHLFDSEDGIIYPVEGSKEMKVARSHFNTMHLHVPVLISYKFYRWVNVSAGAVIDFNTYTATHTKYKIGNTETRRHITGLHQRQMTIQPTVIIGFDDFVGLYVRYSPMSYFRKGYGPDFSTISGGFTFIL